MIVNTRPGTNWPAVIYQHVGYDTATAEIAPTSVDQTIYSFANIVEIPAQLKVFVIDEITGLATTLYPTEYTINWVEEFITLNSPISYDDKLMIEVYQVGNGDQLVKSNTQVYFSNIYWFRYS